MCACVACLRPSLACARVRAEWYARVCSEVYDSDALHNHRAHLTVQRYLGVTQEFVREADVLRRLCQRVDSCNTWTGDVEDRKGHGDKAREGEASPRAEGLAKASQQVGDQAGFARNGAAYEWEQSVEPRLLSALARVFRLLVERAQGGDWSAGKCRALYGIDCIFAESVSWQSTEDAGTQQSPAEDAGSQQRPAEDASRRGPQPVLLEVNYSPDYGKMLELYPAFLDDVFAKLFLSGEAIAESADQSSTAGEALWQAVPV